MSSNACLDAALRELAEHGIRDIEVVRGAKHPQLRFRVNGGPIRIFALPGTPSDWRSPKNVRRDLRRLLREAGVIRDIPKPPPALKLDRVTLLEQRVRAMEQRIAELEGSAAHPPSPSP